MEYNWNNLNFQWFLLLFPKNMVLLSKTKFFHSKVTFCLIKQRFSYQNIRPSLPPTIPEPKFVVNSWNIGILFTCKVIFEAQSMFSQDIHKRTLTIQLGTKLTACVVLFFFFKWTKSLRNYKERERERERLIFPV